MAIIAIIAGIVACDDLLARAGGGGDWSSGSGGGDGDGIGQLIYILLRVIPFPYNFIVAAIALVIYFYYQKNQKAKSVFNSIPRQLKNSTDAQPKGVPAGFHQGEFLQAVSKAFVDVQQAWAAGDIGPVRRYISDGVYQRFHTQIEMMKLLKQTNTLEEIRVIDVDIDEFETDGDFDIVHVGIRAHIHDRFSSALDGGLDSGGREEFLEYWSFMRKKAAEGKNMFTSDLCPSCGAGLPDNLGELAKCSYCETIVNTGEFDWVLAEITQANDYAIMHSKAFRQKKLKSKLDSLRAQNLDFGLQALEDKCSNGYLQILLASARRDEKAIRRFVSDEMFTQIKHGMAGDQIAYNRLYLNEVMLVGVQEKGNLNELAFYVKSSFQRVKLSGDKVSILDRAVYSNDEIVLMSRDRNAAVSKGSVYAHACPSCGASVVDSLEVACSYCEAPLNSTSREWIITGRMSTAAYQGLGKNAPVMVDVTPAHLQKGLKLKDYALNNLMVVLSVDGAVNDQEKLFTRQQAKKWGYKPDKLEGFFRAATGGHHNSITMPDSPKLRNKIYKMMEKAAHADEQLSSAEKELLAEVKRKYSIAA